MRNKLQTCLRRILLGGSAMVLATGALATAADLTIQRHETAGIVDLVPGADRGTITQPLLIGTIASTGQQVLFVITDASDANFAEMFGAIRADGLTQAPEEAVEQAVFENGNWTFFEDPGLVARFEEEDDEVLRPVANPKLFSFKENQVEWQGRNRKRSIY